jgi:soluble lytic murein transglycosylase-like protein
MKNGMPIRLAIVAVLLVVAAVPARAQIYTWHDANGNLVLSDHARDGAVVKTFAVPKADSLRVTRFAASSRAGVYDDLILEHARMNGVRPSLVRAVVQVESGFNPAAVSAKGALGLMQLMPATARHFHVGNPFNPVENVRAGVAYLKELLVRYNNKEELALAAYNAGPGAVDRHGLSVPPYRETQSYVSRISRMAGEPPAAPLPDHSPATRIYRAVEMIDGREVIRYTDRQPGAGH